MELEYRNKAALCAARCFTLFIAFNGIDMIYLITKLVIYICDLNYVPKNYSIVVHLHAIITTDIYLFL